MPIDWHLLWFTLMKIGFAYLLAMPTGPTREERLRS
jgi:hypothetical protein